jgi:hypothetical protein
MHTRLLVLATVLLFQACGTIEYKPTEYPLRAGLIPPFNVAGDAQVTNGQTSAAPVIVYSYGGSNLSSNLKAITETMVQQTRGEIAKNGRVAAGGKPKTIELKVNSLLSEYSFMFWKSKMQFQAKLGNGQTVEKLVTHGSGSVHQDLNGCIAESVMMLLKDERVVAYLGK